MAAGNDRGCRKPLFDGVICHAGLGQRQHLAELVCEGGGAKGLQNEFDPRVESTLMDDCISAVSSRVKHLEPGTPAAGFIGYLAAIHAARQDAIGEAGTDPGVAIEDAERHSAVHRFKYVIAEVTEQID